MSKNLARAMEDMPDVEQQEGVNASRDYIHVPVANCERLA
jgi:hypothetical protein